MPRHADAAYMEGANDQRLKQLQELGASGPRSMPRGNRGPSDVAAGPRGSEIDAAGGCQPEKGLASTISTLTSRPLGAVYDTVSPTDPPSMAEPSGDWGL
jgi:hypothetical protein